MDVKLELGPAGQDYDHIEPLDSKAGMSDLFCAHKKGLDVDVIIKRVRRSVQNEVDEQNEAEILKKVKHQYLPQIYDIIRGKDGYLYTVMDLIHGENLQDYVQAHGSITQQQAYLWGCQLCEAVEYLQEEKDQKPVIIHCDIKPSNVMITESGDICLIDFGISLISRSYVKASTYLTPGYAAPEQYYLAKLQAEAGAPKPEEERLEKTVLVPWSGLTAEDPERTVFVSSGRSAIKSQGDRPESDVKISKYTDIYAIGATLYFAVSGKRPESAIQEVTPLSKLKPAISDSMLAIIMRAMEKAPDKRFQDAAAMLDALHHVDQMDSAYRKFVGQKRAMVLVLSAAFLLSAGSTAYGFYRMRAERENAYLNLISQAQEASDSGHYKEGQDLLETAIQQQPARADAYLDLAVLFYEQGEYQAAIDLVQNASLSGNLELDGMDPIVKGELYYIQGSCLYELGEYEQAIDALQQAVDSPDATAAYYRSLAIALANNREIDQAQAVLDELEKKGGSASDCDVVRAEIEAIQGEYQEAMALYRAVFHETKDQQLLSHAYLAAAQLCQSQGDLLEAISVLEQAQNVLSGYYNILQRTMLADLYGQAATDFPEQAQRYYTQASNLLDSLISDGVATFATWLNMASIQQALGNYEESEQYLLELHDLYPQDYRPEMQLAYLYIDWQSALPMEQRDYHKALACYDASQEKYQQALANGQEDQNMVVLNNLIDQLRSAGWL